MAGELLVGFPSPGGRLQKAYQDLWLAKSGTDAQKKQLGNPALLPHPWEPETCRDPELRAELWRWLDQVAAWINSDYVWEIAGMPTIPECWPLHPHLVHELAVVADQRRRAGIAENSDLLENWHRYVLPGFLERLRHRMKQSCEDGHSPWPGRSQHARFLSDAATEARAAAFAADQKACEAARPSPPVSRPQLTIVGDSVVDVTTGEVL